MRILTYTILIKAVIDSFLLISMTLTSDILITASYTAAFINTVACVICLIGVTALSKRFVYVLRLMVTVLMLMSVMILMYAIGRLFTVLDPGPANIMYIERTLMAAVRIVFGVAFLFLMKGFGESLKDDGDEYSASATEKTGIIYMCCSSMMAFLKILDGTVPGVIVPVSVIIYAASVIIEILMYRRAYEAAFCIWRKHTFSDTD